MSSEKKMLKKEIYSTLKEWYKVVNATRENAVFHLPTKTGLETKLYKLTEKLIQEE